MSKEFIFTDDLGGIGSGALVHILIPKSVASKAELMGLLSKGLRFPEGFGANWDALYDCLCDLAWITEKQIVIAHEGIPSLLLSEDVNAYLGVLKDAVNSWRDKPGVHELLVIFKEDQALGAEGRRGV